MARTKLEVSQVGALLPVSHSAIPRKGQAVRNQVTVQRMEEEDTICIEDRMRELRLLSTGSYLEKYNDSTISLDDDTPAKKIRAHILSMNPDDAYKFLETLASAWKTRSNTAKHILPWIYWLLAIHGRSISSQELSSQILDNLRKMISVKCAATGDLRKLSSRLQLIMAQINKAGNNFVVPSPLLGGIKPKEGEDEEDDEEDEEIDEIIYGEEEDASE